MNLRNSLECMTEDIVQYYQAWTWKWMASKMRKFWLFLRISLLPSLSCHKDPLYISFFFFFLPFCRLPFSDCSVAYIVSPKVGIQAWNLPDLPVAYSLISSCPNYKLPGRRLLSSSNQRSTLSPITHSRKAPCSTGLTLLGLSETGSQKKKVWNQEKWFLSFISDFSRTIYYIYTGSSNWHK